MLAGWIATRPAGARVVEARSGWSRWGNRLLLANAVAATVVWAARMGTGSIPVAFGWL